MAERRVVMVAGATGLVGSQCLQMLAGDPYWTEVRALVRRRLPADLTSQRVRELATDFDNLDRHPDWFEVDAVVCALGTTMGQAGSKEAFRKVDYDYVLSVARQAHKGGARRFLMVSSVGADAGSRVFYLRVKGEVEQAVQEVGFDSVVLVRPSFLVGKRDRIRWGEVLGRPFAALLPRRLKPITAERVANVLAERCRLDSPGVVVLENSDMLE